MKPCAYPRACLNTSHIVTCSWSVLRALVHSATAARLMGCRLLLSTSICATTYPNLAINWTYCLSCFWDTEKKKEAKASLSWQAQMHRVRLMLWMWDPLGSTHTGSPQPCYLARWARCAVMSAWLWTVLDRQGQRAAGQCHCAGPSGRWTGTSCSEKKKCRPSEWLQRTATEIQATDFLGPFVRPFWMHDCCHSFFCWLHGIYQDTASHILGLLLGWLLWA